MKRSISKKSQKLFDRPIIKFITLIGAIIGIVGGILSISLAVQNIFPQPSLEITPFHENGNLSLVIQNYGNKIAQIKNYTICQPLEKGYRCGYEEVFGEPLNIPAGGSIITLDTKNPIGMMQYYMDKSNNWEIRLCENSLGCKMFKFQGVPPPKDKVTGIIPPPPIIIPSSFSKLIKDINFSNLSNS